MANYLLIESREPAAAGETGFCSDLACRLAAAGDRVTLFLVQNGVLPARSGAAAPGLADLARSGVEVLADDFSLRERGIPLDRLQPGVKASPLDVVVNRMVEGCKTIWH